MTTVTTLSPMNPNTLNDTVTGIAALRRSITRAAAPGCMDMGCNGRRGHPPGL